MTQLLFLVALLLALLIHSIKSSEIKLTYSTAPWFHRLQDIVYN